MTLSPVDLASKSSGQTASSPTVSTPVAWTIAGSDSCAGAGIQADIKTMQGLSVYCASVITSVTAQNTRNVFDLSNMSAHIVAAQLNALNDDMPPAAIKIGMVGSAEIAETVAKILSTSDRAIVYDPVMVATSGDALIDGGALSVARSRLVPLATVVTPNWSEAHVLAERESTYPLHLDADNLEPYVEALARDILARGARSVLLKGGHLNENSEYVQDFWTDGTSRAWLTSHRQFARHTHGTGCTLSSAIAAGLASGLEILDAIVMAKAYVNQALRLAPQIGSGRGPLAHLPAQFANADLPWLTQSAANGLSRPQFYRDDAIGFYPVVPDSDWVERVASAGARTVQLRIKNKSLAETERQIALSVEIAKRYECKLYVNDFWELAIAYGAFGVHLGQEDILQADVEALSRAGLRLGVSTHCYSEVARALAVQPSYIAIGPIFPTTTKVMKFSPQGFDGLSKWANMLDYPLVAIGGITLGLAGAALRAGASGVAVVRDVVDNSEPAARVRQWIQQLAQ